MNFEDRVSYYNGRKILIQDPKNNNCNVIAILNAALQDQDISNKKLQKIEARFNKFYDINNKGLSVTCLGHIAWELGYKSSINILASNYKEIFENYKSGQKIIRMFGWRTLSEFRTDGTKIIATNGLGCHASFVIDMKPSGDCTFVNPFTGIFIRDLNWFNIGVPEWIISKQPSSTELTFQMWRK